MREEDKTQLPPGIETLVAVSDGKFYFANPGDNQFAEWRGRLVDMVMLNIKLDDDVQPDHIVTKE